MEYLGELIALGIDSIIFCTCLKQYFHYKNSLTAVKGAEFHEVGAHLNAALKKAPDNTIGYVAIRGVIKSLGKPLRSVKKKDLTGVLQKFVVKEHVVARTTAGFWSDQKRTMEEVCNSVPFVLHQGPYEVEVIDPTAAEILDMDTIYDAFDPSVPTVMDHLWGFFTGVRQRGVQTTEEMLREGAVMTGVGQLSRLAGKSDGLALHPPENGTPFYLTSMSVSSLIRTLDDRRRTYRWLCVMFGAIGILIGGIVIRRYWKDREEQRLAEQMRQSLAASRKERRRKVRDEDLKDDQLCVVCRSNPREIILLPCGHVCLCEDCSEDITSTCPVCRARIVQRNAAYYMI